MPEIISEWFVTSLMLAFIGTYVFLALRRLYRQRWWQTLLKALTVTVAFFLVLPPYRLVLYFATLGWVKLFGVE